MSSEMTKDHRSGLERRFRRPVNTTGLATLGGPLCSLWYYLSISWQI